MARFDQLFAEETAPILPDPSNNAIVPEASDPAEVEDMFNPSAPRLPQPDPMRTQVAEAAPPMPVRSDAVQNSGQSLPADPAAEPAPLIPDTDTRYQDPANLLVADVIMGGALPWLQATADVAAGRVPADQFDAARQEHQTRIDALRKDHPDFVSAAENAAPFLAGLGLSIAKPARSIGGALARGAGAAAPIGAVQGYTGGPIDEPSLSSERLGNAVGRAAKTAILGAAGAATAKGFEAAKGSINSRAAGKKAAYDQETAEIEKRGRDANERRTRDSVARAKAEDDSLDDLYRTVWSKKPSETSISKDAKANFDKFDRSPMAVYKWASKFKDPLDALSRSTGQPAIVIAKRLKGKELPIDTPGEYKLYEQLTRVNRGFDVANKRGYKEPKPDTPPDKRPKEPDVAPPPKKPDDTPPAPPPAGDASKPVRPRLPGKSLADYEADMAKTMRSEPNAPRKPDAAPPKKPATKKPSTKKPAADKAPTKKEIQATKDFIDTIISTGKGTKEKARIRKRLWDAAKKDDR